MVMVLSSLMKEDGILKGGNVVLSGGNGLLDDGHAK